MVTNSTLTSGINATYFRKVDSTFLNFEVKSGFTVQQILDSHFTRAYDISGLKNFLFFYHVVEDVEYFDVASLGSVEDKTVGFLCYLEIPEGTELVFKSPNNWMGEVPDFTPGRNYLLYFYYNTGLGLVCKLIVDSTIPEGRLELVFDIPEDGYTLDLSATFPEKIETFTPKYSGEISWGDEDTTYVFNGKDNLEHTYSSAGEYKVTITGFVDGLGKVPSTVVRCEAIKNVHYFGKCFSYCTKFAEIPDGFFNDILHQRELNGCFQGTAITSIPEDLFPENFSIVKITSLFSECLKLEGDVVPEKLLKPLHNLSECISLFDSCFYISKMPTNFFKYNKKLKRIDRAFAFTGFTNDNEDITDDIPSEVFDNVNIHDTEAVFSGIGSFTLLNIFKKHLEDFDNPHNTSLQTAYNTDAGENQVVSIGDSEALSFSTSSGNTLSLASDAVSLSNSNGLVSVSSDGVSLVSGTNSLVVSSDSTTFLGSPVVVPEASSDSEVPTWGQVKSEISKIDVVDFQGTWNLTSSVASASTKNYPGVTLKKGYTYLVQSYTTEPVAYNGIYWTTGDFLIVTVDDDYTSIKKYENNATFKEIITATTGRSALWSSSYDSTGINLSKQFSDGTNTVIFGISNYYLSGSSTVSIAINKAYPSNLLWAGSSTFYSGHQSCGEHSTLFFHDTDGTYGFSSVPYSYTNAKSIDNNSSYGAKVRVLKKEGSTTEDYSGIYVYKDAVEIVQGVPFYTGQIISSSTVEAEQMTVSSDPSSERQVVNLGYLTTQLDNLNFDKLKAQNNDGTTYTCWSGVNVFTNNTSFTGSVSVTTDKTTASNFSDNEFITKSVASELISTDISKLKSQNNNGTTYTAWTGTNVFKNSISLSGSVSATTDKTSASNFASNEFITKSVASEIASNLDSISLETLKSQNNDGNSYTSWTGKNVYEEDVEYSGEVSVITDKEGVDNFADNELITKSAANEIVDDFSSNFVLSESSRTYTFTGNANSSSGVVAARIMLSQGGMYGVTALDYIGLYSATPRDSNQNAYSTYPYNGGQDVYSKRIRIGLYQLGGVNFNLIKGLVAYSDDDDVYNYKKEDQEKIYFKKFIVYKQFVEDDEIPNVNTDKITSENGGQVVWWKNSVPCLVVFFDYDLTAPTLNSDGTYTPNMPTTASEFSSSVYVTSNLFVYTNLTKYSPIPLRLMTWSTTSDVEYDVKSAICVMFTKGAVSGTNIWNNLTDTTELPFYYDSIGVCADFSIIGLQSLTAFGVDTSGSSLLSTDNTFTGTNDFTGGTCLVGLPKQAAAAMNLKCVFPIGAVFTSTENTSPGDTMTSTSWSLLGTSTVGSTTLYYWQRTS